MVERDAYRRIARVYDRVIEPFQAGVRRVALSTVPPEPGWRVLDVGCGTGMALAAYREAGCEVSGVDVSPAMLEQARDRLGESAALHLTDGTGLPVDDASVDLVTTTMVLHEVPAEERRRFLAEMARVVTLDGTVMIVDFRFGSLRTKGRIMRGVSWLLERVSGHFDGYRSFRKAGGVPSLLGEAGLELERERVVAGGNVGVFVARRTGG